MTDFSPKKYWTFLIKEAHISSNDYRVKGWFVVITHTPDQSEQRSNPLGITVSVDYITPAAEPTEIVVNNFIRKIDTDQVTYKMLEEDLTKALGSIPFETVPPAPVTIPIHRVPPSKRAKVLDKIRSSERAGTTHQNR